MTKSALVLWQVKKARNLVYAGKTILDAAREMRLPYGPVRNAVTGLSWGTIQNPPPVPSAVLRANRQRPLRVCSNCGKTYRKGGTTQRCGACYNHLHRHGVERVVEHLHQRKYARVSAKQLEQMYKQYQAGCSLEQLVATCPFSAETLRRRFAAAGYVIRSPTALRVRLTPALVRHARQLHYEQGMPISVVASQLGVSYQTLYTAVVGHTWRHVSGLPEHGEKRPCITCEMLTADPSGLCCYCRGGHDV